MSCRLMIGLSAIVFASIACKSKAGQNRPARLLADESGACTEEATRVAQLEDELKSRLTFPIEPASTDAEFAQQCNQAGGVAVVKGVCHCQDQTEIVAPNRCADANPRTLEVIDAEFEAAKIAVGKCRLNSNSQTIGELLLVETVKTTNRYSVPICRSATEAEVCGERHATSGGNIYIVQRLKGFDCASILARGVADQKALIRSDNQVFDVLCNGADRMNVLAQPWSAENTGAPLEAAGGILKAKFSGSVTACTFSSCEASTLEDACRSNSVGILGPSCDSIYIRADDGFHCEGMLKSPPKRSDLMRSGNALLASCSRLPKTCSISDVTNSRGTRFCAVYDGGRLIAWGIGMCSSAADGNEVQIVSFLTGSETKTNNQTLSAANLREGLLLFTGMQGLRCE